MVLEGLSQENAQRFNARRPVVIFLHGTMGAGFITAGVRLGLEDAGLEPDFQDFHWNWGMTFFFACTSGHAEHVKKRGRELARRVTELKQEQPDRPVFLIGQSAGCNVIRWALEALPTGVEVESAVMLAPSIAATVDMGKALGSLSHRLYYTRSRHDGFLLGLGTSLVGTPDRDFGPSAGYVGFERTYPKLVELPWRPEYLFRAIHFGDHAGGLNRRFVRYVVARCLAEEGYGESILGTGLGRDDDRAETSPEVSSPGDVSLTDSEVGPVGGPKPALRQAQGGVSLSKPGARGQLRVFYVKSPDDFADDHTFNLVRGLMEAGLPGSVEVFDWSKLWVFDHTNQSAHRQAAGELVKHIAQAGAEDPALPVVLIGRSAGTQIIRLALEALAERGERVSQVVFLQSSISQDADLSRALSAVEGELLNVYSFMDFIPLGLMCQLFRTSDGPHQEGGGYRGFLPPKGPENGSAESYGKLKQVAVDAFWRPALEREGFGLWSLRKFSRDFLAKRISTNTGIGLSKPVYVRRRGLELAMGVAGLLLVGLGLPGLCSSLMHAGHVIVTTALQILEGIIPLGYLPLVLTSLPMGLLVMFLFWAAVFFVPVFLGGILIDQALRPRHKERLGGGWFRLKAFRRP